MSDQPIERPESVRVQRDPNRIEQLQDYSGALRTIRASRGVFLLILILSLLLHVGAYCATRWGGLLQPVVVEEVQEQIAHTSAEPAHSVTPDAETIAMFSNWYYLTELTLPVTEFFGQVCCGLLTICFLFAALVCLSGGLGGVRGSIAAFFWTLLLLALLFPWERWLGTVPHSEQIPGIYFTFKELCQMPQEFPNMIGEILHYARFLGFPLLALLIAFIADRRYARGYRLVQRHLESRLNVKRN
ncbi:MAG: hypothetical protein KAV82_05345 [Phycisphaerae bacterium]|nr:hypothetical protein [Phycisphaerae bacterium]